MKVAIIGAGAIGGWLGVRLAKVGHSVTVLARGSTLEAIQTRGWSLQEGGVKTVQPVTASDDPAGIATTDSAGSTIDWL